MDMAAILIHDHDHFQSYLMEAPNETASVVWICLKSVDDYGQRMDNGGLLTL